MYDQWPSPREDDATNSSSDFVSALSVERAQRWLLFSFISYLPPCAPVSLRTLLPHRIPFFLFFYSICHARLTRLGYTLV